MTLILSNDDVEKLLPMDECIEVMEEAYVELAEGRGVSRTRSDCFAPTLRPDALYSLKSMDGVIPNSAWAPSASIPTSSLAQARQQHAPRKGAGRAQPAYVGLVLLFSVENGEPLAILPDGVMQRMRVGAANGLGIKHLARADAKTVGILGSGWQAGAQLMAACAVRNIATIRCFSPTGKTAKRSPTPMTALLGIEVEPVAAPQAAIAGADIAMCATNSIDQIFFAAGSSPGCM